MLSEMCSFDGITGEAKDALLDHGCVHLRYDFEVWCHSAGETCRCQSHDPGQYRDRFNMPIPACKANFHLSPFQQLQAETDLYYSQETDTLYEIVCRFTNGDVLEYSQSKHWAAQTDLIRGGQPTRGQLAQMEESSKLGNAE